MPLFVRIRRQTSPKCALEGALALSKRARRVCTHKPPLQGRARPALPQVVRRPRKHARLPMQAAAARPISALAPNLPPKLAAACTTLPRPQRQELAR